MHQSWSPPILGATITPSLCPSTLLSGSDDGTIRVWDAVPAASPPRVRSPSHVRPTPTAGSSVPDSPSLTAGTGGSGRGSSVGKSVGGQQRSASPSSGRMPALAEEAEDGEPGYRQLLLGESSSASFQSGPLSTFRSTALKVLTGHTNSVTGLEVLVDSGGQLLSCSLDGSLRCDNKSAPMLEKGARGSSVKLFND